MNALDFLKKHDAKRTDVFIFKYGNSHPRLSVLTQAANPYFTLYCPHFSWIGVSVPEDVTPIALYRCADLWDPGWWEQASQEMRPDDNREIHEDFWIQLIAKAEPEAFHLKERTPEGKIEYLQTKLIEMKAENDELRAQLAKIREVIE